MSIEDSEAIEKTLKQPTAKATALKAIRQSPGLPLQTRSILTRRDLVSINCTMDEAMKGVIIGGAIARERGPFSNASEKA